ncbi:TPA: sulfurtransferase TusA family protein [Haemophilus influenzae]|uniref:Selenium metabolism protein YedF n=1 Tax=Haemophilus influenzae TaxID=727 RepID=A0A158SZX7_HAEIF|nr:sulfurtransferase TusA family protein [Haemophilus influenzae]KIS36421.1 selenium metabolism protein YedF [Haemophilus influenzae]MCK8864512.1 sulfurtransferase TusA family protein [Haemophilus influenzae]MDO7258408.1 sulfurtransferase TusA family protein [Haemophilus influenzae]MDO7276096.1 sulfurtransferase TusA family protein [Haemophilus influenzae]
MKYQLNLTALRCPIPLLSAKKALENLNKNDELMLILNLESAVENFSIFAEKNSVALVEQYYASEKEFIVILKK